MAPVLVAGHGAARLRPGLIAVNLGGDSGYTGTMATTKRLSDAALLNICKRALACIKASDAAGAERAIREVPPAQRGYVVESLRGAVEDKRAKAAQG